MTSVREFVIWNKILYNNGGKWIWEPVIVAAITASAIVSPILQTISVIAALVSIKWAVGWIDWRLRLSQTENELALRKLNPYLEMRLDKRGRR